MKRFRSLIAFTLSLALVVLSPGSSAYHAAAQTMGAAANGSAATGVTGVAGANRGRTTGVSAISALSASALDLSSVLSAPSITPVALARNVFIGRSAVSPIVANAAAAPAALHAITPAVAKAVVSANTGEIETLKTNLSAPSPAKKPAETLAAEAREQFDGEALKSALSAPVVSNGMPVMSNAAVLAAKSKDSGMPDEAVDSLGNFSHQSGDIDEIGNPRRIGVDPFRLFGGGLRGGAAATVVAAAASLSFGSIAVFPMIIFSLVLHEIGHARMAEKLGDQTARRSTYWGIDFRAVIAGDWSLSAGLPMKIKTADRGSFNPKHWGSHIDPIRTVLVPIFTFLAAGMMFGGARPVPVETRNFKGNLVKGMALVALAGPAVNMGLAVAGALAVTGAMAAGLGAGVVATLGMFVLLNVMLALFNLIPLPPLDGSHIFKPFLPYRAQMELGNVGLMGTRLLLFVVAGMLATGVVATIGTFIVLNVILSYFNQSRMAIANFMERMGPMGIVLLVVIAAGGAISAASMFIANFLIGGAISVTGVQLAGAYLPAVAALGLAVGQLGASKSADLAAKTEAAVPAPPGPANGGANGPVDLIVMFGEKKTTLSDSHISNVDVNQPAGVEQYTRLQQAMLAQLATAGLDGAVLEPYKGTPLATYARINAATIRVDGVSVAEFTRQMVERGFTVYPNSERKIIRPIDIKPEDMDPDARSPVTMDENLKIVKADTVQAEAVKMWGEPELGFWSGLWATAFKSTPPQPKFGVIDSGAAVSHPLLRRVKEVVNMTSGENIDDIGHGSWVTSTMLHLAPWSRNTTHYKTFLNGSATLDDILKSLTQAGNDGNLVISNSWGSDEGDPKSPDSLLVLKLAQEGHIMVFAAGNAGSGKNTIGSPAIVTYKDPATGAIRVVSVAAAGRDMKVAYFSSRGPGSAITAKTPGYPHRPDLTAVGYNVEGAWPAELGDADRVDGEKGPVKAISGTSMSTPAVAGALMLLAMMFGVTEVGPKLDAVVNAVMSTLEKTGKNSYDEEGEGFLNVSAAYLALQRAIGPQRGGIPVVDIALYRSLRRSWDRLYIGPTPGNMSQAGYAGAMQALSRRIGDLEARHPGIERHAGGPLDVSIYRAHNEWLATLKRSQRIVDAGGYSDWIRPEDRARIASEIDAITGRIKAMESADDTLAYRAAGPVKRLFLKLVEKLSAPR